jgi:hypothetical protein
MMKNLRTKLSRLSMLGVIAIIALPGLADSTSLSYAPSTVTLDGTSLPDIALTATTSSGQGFTVISEGKVQFEMATDGETPPTPVASGYPGAVWINLLASPADWTGLSTNDSGVHPSSNGTLNQGEVTESFNLDAVGATPGMTIGLRAHYITGGGKTKVSTHFSPSIDVVIASFCEGFLLSTDLASGAGSPAPGDDGEWTFRVRARNCTGHDLEKVKIQGGTNGWGNFDGFTRSAGEVSVRYNKRNEVLTWVVDLPDGAEATLDIAMTGTISPGAVCSTDLTEPEPESVRHLSGSWSASNQVIGKVEAPSRVSIIVACPVD